MPFNHVGDIMKTVLVKVQGSVAFKALEVASYSDLFKAAGVTSEYQVTDVDTNSVLSSSNSLTDGQRLLLTLKTKGA